MNIHEDKSEMLADVSSPVGMAMPSSLAQPAPFAVTTMQTPDQQQALARSNYPRHAWGDVRNLSPMRRGHGY